MRRNATLLLADYLAALGHGDRGQTFRLLDSLRSAARIHDDLPDVEESIDLYQRSAAIIHDPAANSETIRKAAGLQGLSDKERQALQTMADQLDPV